VVVLGVGGSNFQEDDDEEEEERGRGGGESVLIGSCSCSTKKIVYTRHPRANVFCELCQQHNPVVDFYQQGLYLSKVGFVCFNVICMLDFSLG